MVHLSTLANDQSTYIVTATFTDAAAAAVTPDSVVWSLTDAAGTVINSRTAVSATPGSSVAIVLSGGDLDYSDGAIRILTVYAVYDSTEGDNLPLREEAYFGITNLNNVAAV